MKDRVKRDIGAMGHAEDWAAVDWRLLNRRVQNLRRRIFRATKNKQWNLVRSLMKLMLRSHSNLLLSVRKVTQMNKGRKTPGIDNQRALTSKARIRLIDELSKGKAWRAFPGKRIYIPKANGKQRPLGILTIKNRAAQAVVKNALEPYWEAQFEPNSYGFRPGRSCHDAVKQCWNRLHKGRTHRWVLDADVQAAFDNISHSFTLDRIGPIPGRQLIKQWLKAGYVEAEIFHATNSGVQQGGVISPLIANVALDGLEKILAPSCGYIRYADDLVVTARSREQIEAIIPIVQDFLADRGLSLNSEKTKIVHLRDGFDFLGFNVRSYKDKCIVKPQKEKVLAFLREIRSWLKKHLCLNAGAVIRHLNPILRGWTNYYRHVNSKQVLKFVDTQVWKAIWNWCLRKHQNKSKAWVYRKYFKTAKDRSWVFSANRTNRDGEDQELFLFQCSKMPLRSHIKVKGDASPDDPRLNQYWKQRKENCMRFGLTGDSVAVPWS